MQQGILAGVVDFLFSESVYAHLFPFWLWSVPRLVHWLENSDSLAALFLVFVYVEALLFA